MDAEGVTGVSDELIIFGLLTFFKGKSDVYSIAAYVGGRRGQFGLSLIISIGTQFENAF